MGRAGVGWEVGVASVAGPAGGKRHLAVVQGARGASGLAGGRSWADGMAAGAGRELGWGSGGRYSMSGVKVVGMAG
jgi:hypothetical protein